MGLILPLPYYFLINLLLKFFCSTLVGIINMQFVVQIFLSIYSSSKLLLTLPLDQDKHVAPFMPILISTIM